MFQEYNFTKYYFSFIFYYFPITFLLFFYYFPIIIYFNIFIHCDTMEIVNVVNNKTTVAVMSIFYFLIVCTPNIDNTSFNICTLFFLNTITFPCVCRSFKLMSKALFFKHNCLLFSVMPIWNGSQSKIKEWVVVAKIIISNGLSWQ